MTPERKEQLFNLIENRVRVLLIFSPPTFGIILGGALFSLWRITAAAGPGLPNENVTVAMAGVSIAVLAFIGVRSFRVFSGMPTRFPTLLRAAPFSAALGLIAGAVIAALKAAGKIH